MFKRDAVLPRYPDAQSRIFFRKMLDARRAARELSAAQIEAQGQTRASSSGWVPCHQPATRQWRT
jgi:hypothetical protein